MRVESRNQKFVIEAVYASWTKHDLATIGMCIDDDAEWIVHVPPGAWHLSGSVRTKPSVMRALRAVVRDFEVQQYRPLKIVQLEDLWASRGRRRVWNRSKGFWLSRARIGYGHRATGLTYEATITNFWEIERGKITLCEALHDAERLRAFSEMVTHQAGMQVR